MRILTVSNCPLVETQGSGYVITHFCQGLRDLGHTVDAFGPETYEIWPQWGGRAKSYRQAIGMVPFVLQQLRRHAYDVLELYGGEAWLLTSLVRSLPGRSFLLVSHSNGLEPYALNRLIDYARQGYGEHPYGKWYRLNQTPLFRLAFTGVDGIVTVSQAERRYALEQGYQTPDRVLAIENPLPETYLGLPVVEARPLTIGYCGSWIDRKGIQVIQTDLAQILAEFPTCSLRLIGVGEGFQASDHFPAALCDRIQVIPFVADRAALQQHYQSLTILVVPSLYESFGLVMAEAMACGCALVAARTGFAADLQPDVEALILDRPFSPQLYGAVRRLLLDEGLRHRIAAAGYQRVQSLHWERAVQSLEATYQDWLAAFRSSHTVPSRSKG